MDSGLGTAGSSIDEKRAWLDARRTETLALRAEWGGREALWSWLRLGIFIALLPAWLILGGHLFFALLASAFILCLFLFSVAKHQTALRQRERFERRLMVIDETLQRIGGAVVCLRDFRRPPDDDSPYEQLGTLEPASAHWALSDQERDDLDLFSGPVGIFGLLNRTSTYLGARRLRDWVENPLLSAEAIRARQARIAALTNEPESRVTAMGGVAALRREDRRLAQLLRAVGGVELLRLPVPIQLIRVWSVVSLIVLITGLALLPGATGMSLLMGLLVINGASMASLRAETGPRLEIWRDTAWAARGFRAAVDAVGESLRSCNPLAEWRSAVCGPDIEVRGSEGTQVSTYHANLLGRIERLIGWTESGGPVHLTLNVIVFLDVHIADALGRVIAPQRDALLRAAGALADVEACAALACFSWEQPVTCVPEPITEDAIRIQDGRHPLVDPARCVGNEVTLGSPARLWVITGSNMAGKSTFLRMVGVNTLLAQIGCRAAAGNMAWRPVRMITDLRTRDSLAAGESYFLAEVRHLRRLLVSADGTARAAENEAPVLGLIDEPFRGTNSQDQSAASVAVVRHLLGARHLILLATHDRHLTELDGGTALRNVHFRENLGASGMVFDHRLHEGPATTRNALRILEIEKYPAELVEAAHAWLRAQESAGGGQVAN